MERKINGGWSWGFVSSKGIESLCTWQAEVIDPAVNGTLNVLASCAKAQTKKVVLTSSISAIIFTNKRNSMGGIDESLWSDLDFCRENKVLWSSHFASYIFLVLIFQGIVKFGFCLLHLLILDLWKYWLWSSHFLVLIFEGIVEFAFVS